MAAIWDSRYGGAVDAPFYYGTEPNSFLQEQEARLPRNSRILCLAEGEGRNAVYLATKGHTVSSIDLSPIGVQKTLALAAKYGVTVDAKVGDLAAFVLEPNSWDGIVSIWAHVPHPLRKTVHASVVSALVPGGVFIFEAYRPRQLELVKAGTSKGGPGTEDLLATLPQVSVELEGLILALAEEVDRDVQEGEGHRGVSACTHLVAVKSAQ